MQAFKKKNLKRVDEKRLEFESELPHEAEGSRENPQIAMEPVVSSRRSISQARILRELKVILLRSLSLWWPEKSYSEEAFNGVMIDLCELGA